MGKKGGSSWLTAVKRAFRSPTKDPPPQRTNHTRGELEDDEEKKREKRRWVFRKQSSNENATSSKHTNDGSEAEQKHAIAVAVATTTAAEAAVATAQAAMEVARLANPCNNIYARWGRAHVAAIIIQTAFRGYLARRALSALKGLVKLQALVRGHNVRKQAKMTLRCMQALVRVQSRILDQRITQSHNNTTQHFSHRRASMSRDGGSSIPDDWDEQSHTIEEVKAMLHSRKQAALRRQTNLSQQMWRGGKHPSIGSEDEFGERASNDHHINENYIKTVEMDTSQPYSYLAPNNNNLRRSNQRPSSPLHRSQQNQSFRSPSRASTTTPIQLRSASPRCSREIERQSYNNSAHTPSLRPNNNNYYQHGRGGVTSVATTIMPNYMAATESAKARIRSQSAPRQRPSTPERDRVGTAKKRLSFPAAPQPYGMGYLHNNLRSPSFKSVVSAFGYEQLSNYSSCCTESMSIGGAAEVSPCTTDLTRWLS